MPIFQIRRGIRLGGFHGEGWQKPKTHGWFAKIFCFVGKWKHPESTVWFETSFALSAFGFKRVLWSKRFMPVVPKPTVEDCSPLSEDQLQLLRKAVAEDRLLYGSSSRCGECVPEKSPLAAWRKRGKRLTTPDEIRDRHERILAVIRERKDR